MTKHRVWIFVTAFVLLAGAATSFGAAGSYLIKAKRIYTVSKGVIEDGMILVENGKITQVGKGIAAPAGVPVIKARSSSPD